MYLNHNNFATIEKGGEKKIKKVHRPGKFFTMMIFAGKEC